MLYFLIRLDDACPKMHSENWNRVELLLDKYNIKPIVGIIPDNIDKDFEEYPVIDDFWRSYAKKWQNKGWIIAQHGLNHNLSKTVRTEYKDIPFENQVINLKEGYRILTERGITPRCFFAPAHTFDNNTIRACSLLGYFDFISDGEALYPYKENGMLFIPAAFDTPHKLGNHGVFTFVFHPNHMTGYQFKSLESFIQSNIKVFENSDIDTILNQYSNRKYSLIDGLFKFCLIMYRKMRKG